MKTTTLYAWLLFVMLGAFTACGDDVDGHYSPEQLAYFQKNMEYLWEKKAAKDENGNLLYKQVVVGKDTALYRVTAKEGDYSSHPGLTSTVYFKDFKGVLIDGKVFQPNLVDSNFKPQLVIPGLRYILLELSPDETVETIIPASLGYLFDDYRGIPGGSTLIFTFKIDKIL